jgi:hypothetical protein
VTRVACADRLAKLMFLPYWIAIRPVSGWVRTRILKQLQRTAEVDARRDAE